MQQQAAAQAAASQGAALYRQGMTRAMHPALAPQQQQYYGSSPGGAGAAGGSVGGMMQGMGLGLSAGDTPSGVQGMMQGMGLGLPPGATPTAGAIQPLGGSIQPPYQGEPGGPGPGNAGTAALEAHAVGSSIPAGFVDGSDLRADPPYTPQESIPEPIAGAFPRPVAPPVPPPTFQPPPGSSTTIPNDFSGSHLPTNRGDRSSGTLPEKLGIPSRASDLAPPANRSGTSGVRKPWSAAFATPTDSNMSKSASAGPSAPSDAYTTPHAERTSPTQSTANTRSTAPQPTAHTHWVNAFQRIPETAYIPQYSFSRGNQGIRLERPER